MSHYLGWGGYREDHEPTVSRHIVAATYAEAWALWRMECKTHDWVCYGIVEYSGQVI